ncbi:hypothetical protein [Akkermansia sp.]|uniref:hypothetical protein n=1 Tax=Akkermansia sp. TaxID=1872421 RepID=UPI003AB6838D
MSCAYALMAMRTKAGISRKMMAAALGYSSRCIFVHRNGKQRKDPYACPVFAPIWGMVFMGANGKEEPSENKRFPQFQSIDARMAKLLKLNKQVKRVFI